MAADIDADGHTFHALGFRALELDVFGSNENYTSYLGKSELIRPWQSFDTTFF